MSATAKTSDAKEAAVHNKSKSACMSIVQQAKNSRLSEIQDHLYQNYYCDHELLLGDSPCHFLCSKLSLGKAAARVRDGRITINRKKICYAYQFYAAIKFKLPDLEKVGAVKNSQNAMVISHLCGSRNCCNPDHMVLEPKCKNDERTHCHFVFRRYQQQFGVEEFMKLRDRACPHEPRCGSIDTTN
jgi:hypothetical protein